jgi:hypothetical protein
MQDRARRALISDLLVLLQTERTCRSAAPPASANGSRGVCCSTGQLDPLARR